MAGERILGGVGLKGFWDLASDDWKPGMDSNLLALSYLTMPRAISRVTALPGSPVAGDVYVVPSGAGSNPNEIAVYDDGAWVYYVPLEGWSIYIIDENQEVQFDGAAWDILAASLADTTVVPGTYGDATNSPQITVDQKGRITAAGNVLISGGGGGGVLSPPLLATFPTEVNIIAGVLAEDGVEGMCISSSSTGSPKTRGRFKPAFASNKTYTAKIVNVSGNSTTGVGMMLRDTASGRFIKFIIEGDKINVSRWSTDDAWASTTISEDIIHNDVVWLQVEDDGTDFIFKVSAGGGAWITILTESRTVYLAAPDEIGFGVEAGQAGRLYNLGVLHYTEVAPVIIFPWSPVILSANPGDAADWTQSTGTGFAIRGADPTEYVMGDSINSAVGQTFTLPATMEASIDAGTAQITASSDMHTVTGDDLSHMFVDFYDASSGFLGRVMSDTVAGTTVATITVTDIFVPPLTRSMTLGWNGTRTVGGELSSYVSDFAATITENALIASAVTLYAEETASDLADYTVTLGTPTSITNDFAPGYNVFSALSGVHGEMYLDLVPDAGWITKILAGNVTVKYFAGFGGASGNTLSTVKVTLEFLDSGLSVLSSIVTPFIGYDGAWGRQDLSGLIPTACETIRMKVRISHNITGFPPGLIQKPSLHLTEAV